MDGEDVHPQTQVAPWNQTFSSQSQQASTSSMSLSLSDMIPKEDHDDDNDEQHASSLNGQQVSRGFTISQGDNNSSISPQPSQSDHMQSPAGSSTFDYGSCHEISQQQLVSQTFDSDVHQGGVDPSYDDDDDDDDDNTQQHHTTSPTRHASNVTSGVLQQQDGAAEENSNGSGSVNGIEEIVESSSSSYSNSYLQQSLAYDAPVHRHIEEDEEEEEVVEEEVEAAVVEMVVAPMSEEVVDDVDVTSRILNPNLIQLNINGLYEIADCNVDDDPTHADVKYEACSITMYNSTDNAVNGNITSDHSCFMNVPIKYIRLASSSKLQVVQKVPEHDEVVVVVGLSSNVSLRDEMVVEEEEEEEEEEEDDNNGETQVDVPVVDTPVVVRNNRWREKQSPENNQEEEEEDDDEEDEEEAEAEAEAEKSVQRSSPLCPSSSSRQTTHVAMSLS